MTECVEMMALEAVNKGFGTIGDQNYKYANVVIDEETGDVMNLKKLLKHPKYTETWTRAAANKYGRLFQECGRNEDGSQRIEGTNACHWIRRNQVPKGKRVSYNIEVADICPEKADPNRVQFTIGGDMLEYTGETSTETSSIETAKLLINSTLSTKGAQFAVMDIFNFYIHNNLEDYQYQYM